MRKNFYILIIILIFISILSYSIEKEKINLTKENSKVKILLVNDLEYIGRIISIEDNYIIFETENGKIPIFFDSIKNILDYSEESGKFISNKYGNLVDPGNFKHIVTTTAKPIKKGKAYFSNYELFILNWGKGITDNFSVALGMLVPLSTEAIITSAGGKYNFYSDNPLDLAIAAGGVFIVGKENIAIYNSQIIGTYGDVDNSFTLGIGLSGNSDNSNKVLTISGGVMYRLNLYSSFIIEYLRAQIDNDSDDNVMNSLIYGIRLFTNNRISGDIGFIKPLEDTGKTFPLGFPLLNFSFYY